MATFEQEHTVSGDTVNTLQITSPGNASGTGLAIVVMAAQRNVTYTITSSTGHTWTMVRDGSVGGQIGGQTTYVYSTPVTSGSAPNFTSTWAAPIAAGDMLLKYFNIIGATTVHDGDEDTETQTEGAVAVTLTSDLVDEGFDASTAEVIVSTGLESPVAGAADQGFADFMHTYSARFTEGAILATLVSAAQGRAEHIQMMYDLDPAAPSAGAESVSGTTNNVAGTAQVRYGSIRLLFDRVARGSGGWSWHNGEPRWQVVRGM